MQGQAPRGWAELSADAPLLIAVPPRDDGDVVTSYRRGSRVRLLGQMYLRWVQVQPAEGVAIGWMDAAALRLLSGTPGPEPTGAATPEPAGASPEPTGAPAADELPDAPGAAPTDAAPAAPPTGVPTPTTLLTGTGSLTPTASPAPPSSTTGQARALAVELLAPSPTPAPAPAPVARTITVTVCRSRAASGTTAATCATAVGGTRVELALASTQELLASGTTAPDGTATLAVSAPAGAALLLRLPAIGVAGAIAERETAITVALPPTLVLNGGAR